MALISGKTIITSISLFHLTMAYFMLFNPRTVDDQILVYILGRSMGLPPARGLDAPSPALAFLGVVLAMLGLSDLVSLGMPEELGALYYWGTQGFRPPRRSTGRTSKKMTNESHFFTVAPIRFMFSMCLVFYSYVFGPSGPFGTFLPGSSRRPAILGGSGSATDGLKNRVIFTFMFIEMVAWFWLWVTLREERGGVVERLRKQQQRSAR
ncbi:Increased loss of mitochondrial DNA protein 1 [Akanthomyces lecanii RCEF 1005]|uniref:Increased loss of mitochondrial DNA protein 1 n=1 Tax=Akanthomyces lecanii RCEF 1005 TaxID=1081108 RepID=A0A168GRM9_CORDF|nr:Increased loss of mitochondrial DNA protein 1 [Akanthomyces lecanii RCEF 1005]